MQIHSHTTKPRKRRFHPVHKRIALHASSILLLMGGGFLPLPFQVAGDTTADLHVSAKVAAPIPPDPAVITSPADGDHFDTADITVNGTCPDNSYIEVFVGDQMAGVSNCTSNTFSVPATLQPGANIVSAKVFNITDDEGPASTPITVYYDPPVEPEPTTPAEEPATPGPPPSVSVPYTYTVHKPGELWEWSVMLTGGKGPYQVVIDWGDGTIERFTVAEPSTFTVSHIYTKAGTYYPLITITDADGNITRVQLLAVVRELPSVVTLQFLQEVLSNTSPWVAWPVYISATLGVGTFWWFEILALRKFLMSRLWHGRI